MCAGILAEEAAGTRVPKVITGTCRECAQDFSLPYTQKERARQANGSVFCSDACRKESNRKGRAESMRRTSLLYSSERMRTNNPMHKPEIRAAMAATLRKIKHKPVERGGNGRAPPVPQELLSTLLGWPMEVVVRTHKPPGSGYPQHYKVDIANRDLKIAIEVDGGSHCASVVRVRDEKKAELLRSFGWTVLRFKNQAVLSDPAACVEAVQSTISRLREPTPTS